MSKLSKLKPITTWYHTTVPSTGVKVKYRAYNVGDERALMMAEESSDDDTMITTLNQIVLDCVESLEKGVTIESFTTYDLEFLFTKIRSKSVGEQSNVILTCKNKECGEKMQVNVNLETVYVSGISAPLTVKLSETRGVKVTHPTVIEAAVIDKMDQEWDAQMAALMFSIREIYDHDDIIDFSAEDRDEKIKFISELSVDIRDQILEYIFNPPEAVIDLKCLCRKCDTDNSRSLKGISNFF